MVALLPLWWYHMNTHIVCEITMKCMRSCYWIAWPTKPGVQSSNTSQVHFTVISQSPVHSRFITYTLCIHRTEMALVWWIWYAFSYICCKFAIGFIVLISLIETCYLKRCDMVRVCRTLGAVSIRKTVLPGMAIPMLKIRRPLGRLIFNMEITIRR